GYTVFTAANGREALDVLAHSPNQGLILLDLMMPVMNGWEFIEAISKIKEYADIPVVLVTAYNDRARDIRVKEIISKPLEFKKLLSVVKEYYGTTNS
ncbi:MAG: response regulator, partial [Alphaproteobacteria bacterium]